MTPLNTKKMKYCKKGDVRFNLKRQKEKTENLQIFLIFNFEGKRLRFYTGKRIDIKKWDEINQRVKINYSESTTLNDYLMSLRAFVDDLYTKEKTLGNKPSVEFFREKISDKVKRDYSFSFFEAFDEFIEIRKKENAVNTIKKYTTTSNHLKDFERLKNYKIDFESINFKFEAKFKKYLIDEVGMTNNTVVKYLKTLKTFLYYALDKGYHKNLEYQKFKVKESEGEIVFLTWDELMKLYNKELTSEKLKKVRDIFCFGCFTGLRYSDLKNLKKENIQGDYIVLKTIKTRSDNRIPLINYSKEILNRNISEFRDSIFDAPSNQKMNDYLKDLGKEAELFDQIQIVRFKGSERIEDTFFKYQVLTTHVARNTFITNGLERGISAEVLMNITTHQSYKSFKRYFKVVDEHKRNEMLKAFN